MYSVFEMDVWRSPLLSRHHWRIALSSVWLADGANSEDAATEENARCSAPWQQGPSEVGETGRLLLFRVAARQYPGASSTS
jgi:hypothetical protein